MDRPLTLGEQALADLHDRDRALGLDPYAATPTPNPPTPAPGPSIHEIMAMDGPPDYRDADPEPEPAAVATEELSSRRPPPERVPVGAEWQASQMRPA